MTQLVVPAIDERLRRSDAGRITRVEGLQIVVNQRVVGGKA